MSVSKPRSTFADRRISRRRLLVLGTAVPAAVVAANALPSRISASEPRALPPTSPVGATPALAAPAYWFC